MGFWKRAFKEVGWFSGAGLCWSCGGVDKLCCGLTLQGDSMKGGRSRGLCCYILGGEKVISRRAFIGCLDRVSKIRRTLYLTVVSGLNTTIVGCLRSKQDISVPRLNAFGLATDDANMGALSRTGTSRVGTVGLHFSAGRRASLILDHYTLAQDISLAGLGSMVGRGSPKNSVMSSPATWVMWGVCLWL